MEARGVHPLGHAQGHGAVRQPAGLARIACPTLIIDGEAEEYEQARSLYDELTCPKTYLRFTEEEAAPLHVQTASLALASQRIFDRIGDTLETME